MHVFLATIDLHLQVKLHMTREQALEAIGSMIKLARNYVGEVEFSAEDAGRTDIDFLCKACQMAVRRRRDGIESAGHGWLCGAGRIWRRCSARCASIWAIRSTLF